VAEYTHKVSGVRVSVDDSKALGSDWEPVETEKPKPRTKKSE